MPELTKSDYKMVIKHNGEEIAIVWFYEEEPSSDVIIELWRKNQLVGYVMHEPPVVTEGN